MRIFITLIFVTILIGILILLNIAPAQAGFLYALNEDTSGNQIYGFSVDETTGNLATLPGFPVATGGNGDGQTLSYRVFYDSLNARLYVINAGSTSVSAYSVNTATGDLTALPFSPISLPSGIWNCVSVHPSGSPVVVGDGGSSQVASFNITSTTAAEASGSPFDTSPAATFSCAFSKDGNYFYAGGDNGDNHIAGFSVNSVTGVLNSLSGSPFDGGASNIEAYASDTQGRLFTASFDDSMLRVFTTSSGIPSGVTGNPFASGLSLSGPIHGVLHPSEFYIVADRNSNSIGVYQITGIGSATTLAAVSGSPFSSGGIFTDVVALNSAGTFLFAANGGTRNITVFLVNPSTGVLSGATTQPFDTIGTSGLITGMVYAQQPTPAAIPTVTEWGMVIFMILAGIGAAYYLRRQKRA